MKMHITEILAQKKMSKEMLVELLSLESQTDRQIVLDHALTVKAASVGRKVYLRGLIELSNVCGKNCYYCGIRAGNKLVQRYTLAEKEVIEAAVFAWKHQFGSLVIQTGEQSGEGFAELIEQLLIRIHERTRHELTITLSCGEQTAEVYQRWKKAGADRYLLRIETTNRQLYYTIHPNDAHHAYENRLEALHHLRNSGFQVGTGVMIGLPGQTLEDLADDLLFFQEMDVDMVGMGPYIEHADTPLFSLADTLRSPKERFELSLMMIALLRINMPYINIASSTALETLDPLGRQKGILAGANVVMPNLTPVSDRVNYQLYNNKPNLDKDAATSTASLNRVISEIGETIGFAEPGNSLHFKRRMAK